MAATPSNTTQTVQTPDRSPATLLGCEQWDQKGRATGRSYRVFINRPTGRPPPEGYPVLFVTDGNEAFPAAAQVTPARTVAGELRSALIVGIGYPLTNAAESLVLRRFDLSPPTPADYAGVTGGGGPYGGADALLDFILEELTPEVEALYPINRSDLSLFGHSLGGLFVLYALFNRPTAFRSYAAMSPAIWWNDQAVLAGEAAFAAQVRAGAVSPRVMITVGALEQATENLPVPWKMIDPNWTPERGAELIRAYRMVDNARELYARLSTLAGLEVEYAEFADETHTSVIPANISRGLGFALRP